MKNLDPCFANRDRKTFLGFETYKSFTSNERFNQHTPLTFDFKKSKIKDTRRKFV